MPTMLYADDIMDMMAQVHQLKQKARQVARSETWQELINGLEQFEEGVNTLKATVRGLKHCVALAPNVVTLKILPKV
jgi:hypothetical protein